MNLIMEFVAGCFVVLLLTKASAGGTKNNYSCYGDLMLLSPTGASAATARGSHLPYSGVPASQTLVRDDIYWLNSYKQCYYKVGATHCLQPALIAAVASRESCGGRILVKSDGWGDCRKWSLCRAYGILQCDIYSSGLGGRCLSYPWYSCDHIEMSVRDELLLKIKAVQRKFPSWLRERQLQGGVAAYNFGVSNVRTWEHLDVGTTGNDYSNDVMARAQYLMRNYGWQ